MKDSISYLPKAKQDDLYYILKLIRQYLPKAEMVILYGSYARNSYVDYDERIEFGTPTSFRSDYDILVVTSGIPDVQAEAVLERIDKIYDPHGRRTPIQFITDGIEKVNSDLSEGRYFYTEVKQDGVMLYNRGNFKLARRRKLRYDEIKQQAEEYFADKFKYSKEFLQGSAFFNTRTQYHLSSFMLHQACEKAYVAIRLVYTLKSGKLHDLKKLSNSVRNYSEDLIRVFPCDSPEEKRLFKLIGAAYIEGRYNPNFGVTKEDIDALVPKVELLHEITERICKERIEYYGSKVEE